VSLRAISAFTFYLYLGSAHRPLKFAANIPYIIGNLCSKFGDNWFIFKKIDGPKFADPRLTAVSAAVFVVLDFLEKLFEFNRLIVINFWQLID